MRGVGAVALEGVMGGGVDDGTAGLVMAEAVATKLGQVAMCGGGVWRLRGGGLRGRGG